MFVRVRMELFFVGVKSERYVFCYCEKLKFALAFLWY